MTCGMRSSITTEDGVSRLQACSARDGKQGTGRSSAFPPSRALPTGGRPRARCLQHCEVRSAGASRRDRDGSSRRDTLQPRRRRHHANAARGRAPDEQLVPSGGRPRRERMRVPIGRMGDAGTSQCRRLPPLDEARNITARIRRRRAASPRRAGLIISHRLPDHRRPPRRLGASTPHARRAPCMAATDDELEASVPGHVHTALSRRHTTQTRSLAAHAGRRSSDARRREHCERQRRSAQRFGFATRRGQSEPRQALLHRPSTSLTPMLARDARSVYQVAELRRGAHDRLQQPPAPTSRIVLG